MARDFEFLERILHKLLLNFTWWVNRKDADGNNVFEGGFLGLDNIGPFDRSAPLPIDGALEQSDGTAWMAMYCLDLLEMSLILAAPRPHLRGHGDEVLRALRYIAAAIHDRGTVGRGGRLLLRRAAPPTTAARIPLKVRSMVGLLPLAATTTLGPRDARQLPEFAARHRLVHRATARTTADLVPHARARRQRRTAAVDRVARAAAPDAALAARRDRVPVTLRAAGPVRGAPRQPFSRRSRRHGRTPSTTSRASRRPGCSAATPTGAGRSGSR